MNEIKPGDYVRVEPYGMGTVIEVEGDAVSILFDTYPYEDNELGHDVSYGAVKNGRLQSDTPEEFPVGSFVISDQYGWGVVVEDTHDVCDHYEIAVRFPRYEYCDPYNCTPRDEVVRTELAEWEYELLYPLTSEQSDAVRPNHYKFPGDVEVIDISQWLTSNAAQAFQYIARSSRIDGNNKGNPVEDLQKAKVFIDKEIERISR